MKRFIADFGYFALFLGITVLIVFTLPVTIGIDPMTPVVMLRSNYGAGAVILVAVWFAGFISGSVHARRRSMSTAEKIEM